MTSAGCECVIEWLTVCSRMYIAVCASQQDTVIASMASPPAARRVLHPDQLIQKLLARRPRTFQSSHSQVLLSVRCRCLAVELRIGTFCKHASFPPSGSTGTVFFSPSAQDKRRLNYISPASLCKSLASFAADLNERFFLRIITLC